MIKVESRDALNQLEKQCTSHIVLNGAMIILFAV